MEKELDVLLAWGDTNQGTALGQSLAIEDTQKNYLQGHLPLINWQCELSAVNKCPPWTENLCYNLTDENIHVQEH
ncbi:hypothetical protein V5799_019680 [Amblyomma americanum]|uniref:Uncharacterized protein n=1 Tax=Amblyomma americanum TaxID=6943 RepID=A0AAQ4EW70_AMBAM